ncbi:MAG TPA: tyrosine-type recombinase/integrase [Aestuariivirgaceae bacterium]|nr:tyrosine-type recombinase/integrase [Aestuariivirgaceae bacterium]
MPIMRFTSRWIEGIRVAERTDFVDADNPGLLLRVTPHGTKSWAYLYRRKADGRRRMLTLGTFPDMGLKDARMAMIGRRKAISDGADPAGDVAELKKVETVDELIDRFLKDYANLGPRWRTELARMFAKDVRPAIGSSRVTAIRRADILAILNAIKDRGGKGVSANRTLAALRKLFNWAVSEGYLEASPASNIPQRVKEEARDRALSESEIRSFWTGLDSADMTPAMKLALRLALVTGQRIGEICSATWAEVDLDKAEWVIPASKTKSKREHMVPLSPLAVDLFREAVAFPNGNLVINIAPIFPARRIRHIDRHYVAVTMRQSLPVLGLHDNPATPHDLRRTVASQMAAMGIAENIVARVLNHSSEIGKTITGRVYIRHSFAAEKRHALDAWAQRLQEIIEGRTAAGNVIKLQR